MSDLLPKNRGEEPSKAAIDELHRRYCAALEKLFEENKKAAGYPTERRLEIL